MNLERQGKAIERAGIALTILAVTITIIATAQRLGLIDLMEILNRLGGQ